MEIERDISGLIRSQFPAFYREEGSLLVDFVVEYYKWLESQSKYRQKNICVDSTWITVKAGSANVVGTGTDFTKHFSNGDHIALCKEKIVPGDYEIYSIDTVTNATHLVIETSNGQSLPDWSLERTGWGIVTEKKNPLFLSRGYLDHQDIDRTLDEFVVYFKQKYLRNIRFDTLVNTRRLVKNSLDLYRSKGTDQSIDLLFKMTFGRPAAVYRPTTDLLRPSDGRWFVPKYLEVVPNEETTKFVNKQIEGLSSGAKAFCDSVIRRTTSAGKILDVVYISAIEGAFETGERINTFDKILPIRECPVVTGSLNAIDVSVSGSGTGFNKGDVVNISSSFGESAVARVTETKNNFGTVTFSLVNGGYGYTPEFETLVSEKILRITNASPGNGSYLNDIENLEQKTANINYVSLSDPLEVGEELFTYHANGAQAGRGVILEQTRVTATSGELRVSVLSGNLEADALYTAANAKSFNTAVTNGYFDTTASATFIGRHANASLSVINASGTFLRGEEVFQEDDFGAKLGNGVVQSYLGNTLNVIEHTGDGFLKNVLVRGSNSGATANVQSVDITIGLVDLSNNPFISVSNNQIKGLASGFTGEVFFVAEGSGAGLTLSTDLLYEEEANIDVNYLRDYEDTPLTLEEFTGNVSVTDGSSNVTGDGTSFSTEIQMDLTGNLSILSGSNLVTGNGTSFTSEIANNDFLEIDVGSENVVRKVLEVSNDTHLTVNLAFGTTNDAVTSAAVRNYVRVSANGSYAEARRVVSIANDTHLTVNSPFSFTNTQTKLERSWGFLANLEANSTYVTIEDCLSFVSINVGKLSLIASQSPGSDYEASPIVRVNEDLIRTLDIEERYVLEISSPTADFKNGELVTQESTNARGLVVESNTSRLVIQNLRISRDKSFVVTTNSSTKIVGTDTATEANVDSVSVSRGSNVHGFNAVIPSELGTSTGAVSSLQVLDSGFGFTNGEEVTGVKDGSVSFTGFANNQTHGTGRGFYLERGGVLSSTKMLQDGVYWQDYSYEVRSSVALERYRDMLKEIVHVAGTALFGSFILDSEIEIQDSARVAVSSSIYEGWFPIHDYQEDLSFYNGLTLFTFGDWNESSPPHTYDLENGPPERRIEFPVGEDLDNTPEVYMDEILFRTGDWESDGFSIDLGRESSLLHAKRGPVDLNVDDAPVLYYDCQTAGEGVIDLQETLEGVQQKNINTTRDIDLQNPGAVNIIYDCELYDETVDLQDTLRRT